MCYISTFIDINMGILYVESPRCKEKLHIERKSDSSFAGREEINVHTQRYEVHGYGIEIDTWFSNAVGKSCSLLRSSSKNYFCPNRSKSIGICRDVGTRLKFVNEAQLLLISEESVSNPNNRLRSIERKGSGGFQIQVDPMRFRHNLVISGGEPLVEDGWRSLKIGSKQFTMINLNPEASEVQRSNEPLATLTAYRRVKGKILFGILLRFEDSNKVGEETCSWLQVGEEIYPLYAD